MENNNERKALISAAVLYFFWGFTFLASKVIQKYVTPFVLLAYRFDIAALLLLVPWLVGKQKLRLKGKNVKALLSLGLMEPCLYFIGEQYGIRYTNSAFSGIMIALIPIVTLIFAALFLKENPSRKQWGFSILSIAGIIVITLSENSGGSVKISGVLFLILAVVTGAAYTTISRGISDEFSTYERTIVVQVIGALFFSSLALIENGGNLSAMVEPLIIPDFLLAELFLSCIASILCYSLFNYAVANAPTAKVVVFCNLTTVVSVIAGVVILGDRFSVVSVMAMVLVLIGIIGVQKS